MLYIVRGLPGSGKSTLARRLTRPDSHFEAGQFFIQPDGSYKFDANFIRTAHERCQLLTMRALAMRAEHEPGGEVFPPVVVSNTFTEWWEVKPYIEIARDTGASVQ